MNINDKYKELTDVVLLEHKKVFQQQDVTMIEKLMKEIMIATRIYIVGAGREGIAAKSFAMRMMHLGKEVHWVWDDTCPGIGEEDLFIVMNGSGKIGHIDYLIDQAKRTGCRIAVVTGSPNERTPRESDICMFVPACVYKGTEKSVVKSVQPMGSLFEQHLFLLFDIIILLLQSEMYLSSEEMEKRHRNIE